MAEPKTKETTQSVTAFLNGIEAGQTKSDCLVLKKMFEKITKKKGTLWSNNMIGYGVFHYKSERTAREGEWPLTGFSPRKQNLTVYIMSGVNKYAPLLKKLGKYKATSGSCLMIKKLEDVDTGILEQIITASVKDMKEKYKVK